MPNYCWSNRLIPRQILKQTPTHVTAVVDGEPTEYPLENIVGWVSDGDRVRVLTTGAGWQWGTVLGFDRGLLIEMDFGSIWTIPTAKNLMFSQKKLVEEAIAASESVPTLEDYEEDEMLFAEEWGLLEPLAEGDRVRIVLAGPPLEHLAGQIATVVSGGSAGDDLITVTLTTGETKILQRKALDLIDPEDTAFSVAVGDLVTCRRAYRNQVGTIAQIHDNIAFIQFKNWPLYPAYIDTIQCIK